MAKIIKFPDQSARVKGVKSNITTWTYQNYAILALFATFLFALVLNISFQNRSSKNRELANYSSSDLDSKMDDYILKSLNSTDNNTEIIFSKKLNAEDKLIFESLVGSYDITKQKGRIASIQLKPGYQGLSVKELPMVLAQYRKALGLSQLDFKLLPTSDSDIPLVMSYELTTKNQIYGFIMVKMGSDNILQSLEAKFADNK